MFAPEWHWHACESLGCQHFWIRIFVQWLPLGIMWTSGATATATQIPSLNWLAWTAKYVNSCSRRSTATKIAERWMNPVLGCSSSTNMMYTILTLKTERFWQIPGKACVGTISRLFKLLCQPRQSRTVQDQTLNLWRMWSRCWPWVNSSNVPNAKLCSRLKGS